MNSLLLPQRAAPTTARSTTVREQCAARQCRPFSSVAQRQRTLRTRRALVLRASAEEKTEVAASSSPAPSDDVEWLPVIAPEELPKGVRKEVTLGGRNLLLFWYRNQIYCTEARSPAEGAYSEGLIKGKFTQDYAIECPTTGTLFSLKDGSIVDWYPTNPVLRVLTPQCRPLELYPVKLGQDAISISVDAGTQGGLDFRGGRGGSDTSIDNNNVFYLEPKVYVEGEESRPGQIGQVVESSPTATPVSLLVTLLAVAGAGVAGTAVVLYYFF